MAIRRQARRALQRAGGLPEESGSGTPRLPLPIRVVQYLFLLCCFGVGGVAIAALSGWQCGHFHTCQVPPCSISEAQLPFGLTNAALPFASPASGPGSTGHNFNVAQRLQASSGLNSGEWNWNQRSNLRIGYYLTQSGDEYSFILTIASTGGTQRQINGPNGASGNVASLYPGPSTCQATFRLQCQEASTRQSLRDRLGFFEFVKFRTDGALKLVLADPKPSCWVGDVSSSDSTWWYDLMLFGPSIVVGRQKDGTPVQGLVYENANCSASTIASTPHGQEPPKCLMPGAAMFYPGNGRSPVEWAPQWSSGAPHNMPQSWTSHRADFVAEMSISAHEILRANAGGSGGGGGGGIPPAGGGIPPAGGGTPPAGGGTPPPGGVSACIGHPQACAPITDQATCQSTADTQGGNCVWQG